MNGKRTFAGLLVFPVLFALGGCGNPDRPSPNNPVTLKVWHTMGSGMKVVFDNLVTEFNSTLGQREGISITADAVLDTPILHEKLLAAAADESGARTLPDMAVIYPAVAVPLTEKGLLADYRDWFSPKELARYVPAFLDEGRLGQSDGPVYVLPFAKSTETLFVNITLFNRFAEEYMVRYGGRRPELADLTTFEGLLATAEKYHRLTDSQSPAAPGDGKTFYHTNSIFNFFILGFEQMGESFIINEKINTASPVFKKLWDYWYSAAVKGYFPIVSGFGNYLAGTGSIIAATASSGRGMYYPYSVTYPDNTKEAVEFTVLPYPVFSGGKKIAIQRGGGMGLFKSTALREYASSVFLKWFTAPEQNLRLTSSTGYMPAEITASETERIRRIQFDNPVVQKAFNVAVGMQRNYAFFVPPAFSGFEELQYRFEKELLLAAAAGRAEYERGAYSGDYSAAYERFLKLFE